MTYSSKFYGSQPDWKNLLRELLTESIQWTTATSLHWTFSQYLAKFTRNWHSSSMTSWISKSMNSFRTILDKPLSLEYNSIMSNYWIESAVSDWVRDNIDPEDYFEDILDDEGEVEKDAQEQYEEVVDGIVEDFASQIEDDLEAITEDYCNNFSNQIESLFSAEAM